MIYKRKINILIASILLISSISIGCKKDDENVEPENVPTPTANLPDITGYPIVSTNQSTFFNNQTEITEPNTGNAFYGQDANYPGNTPSYTDNGDGTLIDNITGLMWQSSLDQNGDGYINYIDKLSYSEILAHVSSVNTAGYTDWRLPTIKEQYSLIMFSGRDISGYQGTSTAGLIPFINTNYFEFNYGDLSAGERLIDVQFATTNTYAGGPEEMVLG